MPGGGALPIVRDSPNPCADSTASDRFRLLSQTIISVHEEENI
jgi:hypothetical protein